MFNVCTWIFTNKSNAVHFKIQVYQLVVSIIDIERECLWLWSCPICCDSTPSWSINMTLGLHSAGHWWYFICRAWPRCTWHGAGTTRHVVGLWWPKGQYQITNGSQHQENIMRTWITLWFEGIIFWCCSKTNKPMTLRSREANNSQHIRMLTNRTSHMML